VKGVCKVLGGFAALGVAAVLFLCWSLLGFPPFSATMGRLAARIDVAHGRYRILGYGLPPLGMDKYTDLLHRRYGVDYHAVAGCIVGEGTRDYAAGYDSVSEPVINRKFRHDVFKEVASETIERRRALYLQFKATAPSK
jgi:hypothetical protein